MKFEFDGSKSITNKEKHGIDFYEAQELWDDPFRIEIPGKNIRGEERYLMIAELNNCIWAAIYTYRENKLRIISVRKTRENERKIYYNTRL